MKQVILILIFLAGGAFALHLEAQDKFLLGVSAQAHNFYKEKKPDISEYTADFHLDFTLGAGLKYTLNDRFVPESYLTGTSWGGNFNSISFDGFILKNFNYGLVIAFKYSLMKKLTEK